MHQCNCRVMACAGCRLSLMCYTSGQFHIHFRTYTTYILNFLYLFTIRAWYLLYTTTFLFIVYVREENNDLPVLLSNNIAVIRKALYMGIMPLEDFTFECNVVHLSNPHRPGVCQPAVNTTVVNILRT